MTLDGGLDLGEALGQVLHRVQRVEAEDVATAGQEREQHRRARWEVLAHPLDLGANRVGFAQQGRVAVVGDDARDPRGDGDAHQQSHQRERHSLGQ